MDRSMFRFRYEQTQPPSTNTTDPYPLSSQQSLFDRRPRNISFGAQSSIQSSQPTPVPHILTESEIKAFNFNQMIVAEMAKSQQLKQQQQLKKTESQSKLRKTESKNSILKSLFNRNRGNVARNDSGGTRRTESMLLSPPPPPVDGGSRHDISEYKVPLLNPELPRPPPSSSLPTSRPPLQRLPTIGLDNSIRFTRTTTTTSTGDGEGGADSHSEDDEFPDHISLNTGSHLSIPISLFNLSDEDGDGPDLAWSHPLPFKPALQPTATSRMQPTLDTVGSLETSGNDNTLTCPPCATVGENPGLCAFLLTIVSVLLILATLPFSLFLCIKVVQEYERAVIFRLGRLVKGGAKGPGIFFIIPCIDSYCKVDLRTVSFDVPPQEILSRDSVTVAVDAVVYYRISNATIAVSNVEDYGRSTRLLAATTLRNVLGTKDLAQILSERELISHIMQSSLDEATDPWGVKVERVEIKDVRLPVQLQRAMAAEAEAAREARAKVIAAEGEQRASQALFQAAEVMSYNPAALQLRYLQTLSSIAGEKNSTIVFPIPMELFRCILQKPENPPPAPATPKLQEVVVPLPQPPPIAGTSTSS